MREVLAIVFEFIISLFVVAGGGWLIYQNKASDFVIASISMVLTFWFSRRQAEVLLDKKNKNNSQDNQNPPANGV